MWISDFHVLITEKQNKKGKTYQHIHSPSPYYSFLFKKIKHKK